MLPMFPDGGGKACREQMKGVLDVMALEAFIKML